MPTSEKQRRRSYTRPATPDEITQQRVGRCQDVLRLQGFMPPADGDDFGIWTKTSYPCSASIVKKIFVLPPLPDEPEGAPDELAKCLVIEYGTHISKAANA